MPCLASTNSGGGQALPPLPTKWPSSQAEWTLFIQRAQARDQAIASGLISLGVNVIPSPLTVFDAITVPPSRVTGATAALSSTARFGTSSLRLTATAATVVLTLGTSGYPIPIAPNGQWIGSVYVQTSATVLAGTFGIVTPVGTYNQNIGDSVQANMWNRLYDTFNLQVDASTSCTVTLTFTGCTVGQTIDLEGFMLETTDGYKMLPSVFQVSSPPRTWTDIPDPGTKPANNADVTAANTAMDTANVAGTPAATVVNTANTANANTPAVINPQFLNGLNNGWTYDYATGFYVISNTDSPDSGQLSHLGRNGQAANPTTAARNTGYVAVQVGQTVIANCCIKAIGCNAGSVAMVRISWRDINHTELSDTLASVTCGPGGTYLQCVSKAVGQAPAGAQFAHLELYFTNHTSGYFTATSCNLGVQPANQSEVPNGGGHNSVTAIDGNGLALIDFTQAGHVSKNLDNIGDGTTYGRPLGSRLSAGNPLIDFAAGYHLNKNLDNVADSSVYLRSIQSSASETVDNADFEASTTTPVPGWAGASANISYATGANAYAGTQSLLVTTTAQYGAATSNRTYPCAAGDTFLLSLAMVNTINAGPTYALLIFLDKTGTSVGNGGPGTSAFGWALYSATVTAPANAVSFTIHLQNNGVAGSQAWYDRIRLSRIRSLATEVNGTLSRTTNLPQRTVTNFPAKVNSTSSYTSTTTSATISVPAFTVLSDVPTSYNAMSATVSGTAGTTVTYYLYFDDPTYAGGTQTLVASTNANDIYTGAGRVYLSSISVTFPSSGTGGGGGAPPVCVSVDAWVICRARGLVQAGGIVEGDELRLVDPATGAERWGKVTMSKSALADCVRVITASGTTLACSTTAPLGTKTGQVLAPDAIGALLAERCYGEFGHSLGVAVEPMGKRVVQHITCANDFFLAGDDPGCLLAHHNLKP